MVFKMTEDGRTYLDEIRIANVLSVNVISVFMQIASDTLNPTTTPITPPSSERIIASIRNCI